MNVAHPLRWMIAGFVLLVIGVLLPFCMVVGLLEPTLPLGFLAYGASFLGLVIGVIGVVYYARTR